MNKQTVINNKRRILNIALLFICFMIFSFVSSNIQANNLNFEASVIKGDGGNDEYVYITYMETPHNYNATYFGKWNPKVSMNGGGSAGSYDSYSMYFHKSPLSTYTNDGTIKMRYDTYGGYMKNIDLGDIDGNKKLKTTLPFVSNVVSSISSNDVYKKVYSFDGKINNANSNGYKSQDIFIDREMFIDVGIDDSGTIIKSKVTRWAIKKDYIKKELMDDGNIGEYTKDGYYKTMFSLAVKTKVNEVYPSLKASWNNAAEAYDQMNNYSMVTGDQTYWSADMFGIKPGSDSYHFSSNKSPSIGTSVLNIFDNYLYIPMSSFGKTYNVVYAEQNLSGNWNLVPNTETIKGTFSLKDGKLVNEDGTTFGNNINIPNKDGYVFNGISYETNQTMPKWENVASNVTDNSTSVDALKNKLEKNYDRLNDNTMIVVKLKQEKPKSVYVRHLVEDSNGKYTILEPVLTNLSQTLIDSWNNDTKKIVKNGYNKINDNVGSVPTGYSEFYKVALKDKMKIDKSRTIMYENATYHYKGYKVGSSTDLKNAENNRDDYTTITNKSQVNVTGTNTYYCIDFFYTKTTPTNPDKPSEDPGTPPNDTGIIPKLDVDPKKDGKDLNSVSEGANGTCKVAYVPAGEQIKPYVETPTYKPYTLVYDLVGFNTDGTNKYDIHTYDTYKLTGAKVDNSTADESTRYFSSNSQNSVVNGNGSVGLSYNVDINSKIITSRDSLKKLSPLDTVTVKSGDNVKKEEYTTVLDVPSNRYNGLREPIGRATYDIVSVVAKGKDSNFGKVSGTNTATVTALNNTKINIYTPLVLDSAEIKSEGSVNHSNKDQGIIQKNTEFTLTPKIKANASSGYNSDIMKDTSKYLKYYYVIFDFDIQLTNGKIVKAGEKIKVAKNASITATPTSGFDESSSDKTDTVSSSGNHIKVIGVTYNMPEGNFEGSVINPINVTSATDKYVDNDQIAKVEYHCDGSKSKTHTDLGLTMVQDAKYVAQKRQDVINIGRIYDFEVTDCLDVNFKNVFRNISSTTGEVNSITGTVYFSGIKQLRIYGNGNNVTTDRPNINKIPSKLILPLGPYKHTASNYVQAPKLGYRISFDLKTSGKYTKGSSNNRYIEIKPTYYYVSKDGNTFNDNIELFYKTSSGKYVGFEGSGYTIYFKPNDGYRYGTTNEATGNISLMSSKLEPLKIGSSSFKLTDNMMSTSDDNYIQSWYGEFKLPNSTLALPKGETDLNKALTNGYIGVKFDITCVDSQNNVRVSYGQNDKSTGKGNTSQWDYEGYMGFSTPGADMPNNSLGLQLENGTWKIANNDMYNKVKGTVALFDTDNRAANDFE